MIKGANAPTAQNTVAWGNTPQDPGEQQPLHAESVRHDCQIYAHLIFSTKDRTQHLDETIRNRVHAYLANAIRKMGSSYAVIGGTNDHIHALFDLGKQQTPPDFPLQIKKESSKFIKALGAPYNQFAWQRGYGMFSVGPTNTDAVEDYIRRQDEHHVNMTFKEEFRAFLDRYGMDYDEQYVWD